MKITILLATLVLVSPVAFAGIEEINAVGDKRTLVNLPEKSAHQHPVAEQLSKKAKYHKEQKVPKVKMQKAEKKDK